MSLQCVVVDDEPLARDGLRILLERNDGVEVVGQARDVVEAEALVRRLRPDAVFVDIEMPGQDGFALVERLDAGPLVVFVTAYAQHAVRGFDVSAVDYLLKPVDAVRLRETLARLEQRIAQRRISRQDDNALCIRDGRTRVLIPVGDIVSVSAAGDYMCVVTPANSHVVRMTMNKLLRTLDSEDLVRVHRSTVVNRRHVVAVTSLGNCAYDIVLSTGDTARSSKRYRATVAALGH